MMPPATRLDNLPDGTWPRVRALFAQVPPGGEVIDMTIGEPKHPFPSWVPEELALHAGEFGKYPDNFGIEELRVSICNWVTRRYGATLDPDHNVMALNGTREGLFNAAMAIADKPDAIFLIPNPFYPVYEIASLAVGATPMFVPTSPKSNDLPDYASLDAKILDRVSIAYICSPSNPQGTLADAQYWRELITLADKHNFVIFADECYADIYRDTPPVGVLEVAAQIGADLERIVSFHSLSKRSNVPGLRSGFVASGASNIRRIKRLRGGAGSPLPNPIQRVSARLWADEAHVVENRALYCDKFMAADHIFDKNSAYKKVTAGFFLWLPVDDGERAALKLWRETGVRTLPGAYLGREVGGYNPGKNFIRVALVAPINQMREGLEKLQTCLFYT